MDRRTLTILQALLQIFKACHIKGLIFNDDMLQQRYVEFTVTTKTEIFIFC